MIEPVVPTRLLRPLPRPLAPVHNETITSYLTRLATVNRLDPEALRAYAAGDRRKSVSIPLDRISILSGQTAHALRHAIPDLCTPTERDQMRVRTRPGVNELIRTACVSCTLARGVKSQVVRHLSQEDVVCLRHQQWIGNYGSTAAEQQPALDRQPEIMAANRLHRRMIRRHGRTMVEAAYHEAKRVGRIWRDGREHTEVFYRLMHRFHPGNWRVAETDPTVEAAAYPQIVGLTNVLASPSWCRLPFGTDADVARFVTEVRRTVAPDFRWNTTRSYNHCDPLVELFVEEAAHRRGQRPFSYRSDIFTVNPAGMISAHQGMSTHSG